MWFAEGGIIRATRQNVQHSGHFHAAGNPGRNELEETQELHYAPNMPALATAYTDCVGQYFGSRTGTVWAKPAARFPGILGSQRSVVGVCRRAVKRAIEPPYTR